MLAQLEKSRLTNDDEKISIGRITLRQPTQGVSAVVGGLYEADRLLLVWKGVARRPIDCEFTIAFIDGAILRGMVRLWCKERRPALCSHIRKVLSLSDHERDGDPRCMLVDQYGRSVDGAILSSYAVDKQP